MISNTTTANPIDTYTFAGSSNQVLLLAFDWASTQAGSADIYFPGATAPSATVTAAAGAANTNTLTLPSDGTYTIKVHSSGANSTSGYFLTFQSLTGGGCSGNIMPCNQSVYGEIDFSTQMTSYRLAASASEGVTLSDGASLVMDIYDPSGSNVVSIRSTTSYTFAVTGIYTVLLHSANYAGSGSGYLELSPNTVGCGTIPVLTVIPTNVLVAPGSAATFNAVAAGTAPLFFQWCFNNVFISGATNSTFGTNSAFVIAQAQSNNAGSYTVIVTDLAGSVTSAPPAVLTITNVPVTNRLVPIITWPNPAPITYPAALSANQFDATATWAGTNVPGTFSNTPSLGRVLNAGSNQTLSVLFTPNDLGTFTTATASVLLTVLRTNLTVTANSASRAYGTANPPLTGELTSLQNNDNITVSFTCSATASSSVGPYPIMPILNDPNNRLPNYIVTTNLGTLTVTAAGLTVTANDATRTYGAPNPPFTDAPLSGLENGDNITIASNLCSATTTSPVARYPIVPILADPNNTLPNYAVATNDGTLTVTSAPLTIKASNLTKPFGEQYPFSCNQFIATGLQNGETIGCVTLTSDGAAASAPVGAYPIVPCCATGGTFSPGNYNTTYSTNGTLTVTNNNLATLDLHIYDVLYITGPSGATYAIQSSTAVYGTNVPSWRTLTNITADTQTQEYIDYTSATNVPQIYQLVPTNAN